jgi:hypothetical protein
MQLVTCVLSLQGAQRHQQRKPEEWWYNAGDGWGCLLAASHLLEAKISALVMQEDRGGTTLSRLARKGQHGHNPHTEAACVVQCYAEHGFVSQHLRNAMLNMGSSRSTFAAPSQ